jgi:putative phage-type endonuclease
MQPESFYDARRGRITASLVGAILGEAPYMTREAAMRSLVRESLGAEREFTGNVATEYGTFHEDGARFEYELETGNPVTQSDFIPLEDWAGCSPDGLFGDVGGLEIKCPFGLRKADAPVPFKTLAEQPHYYSQVQFSMFVTGRDYWHFYQWTLNGTKLESVTRDMAWQAQALPRLKQFYAEYLHEVEHNAAEYLAPKRAMVDTPASHKMVAEWDELNEAIDNATGRKKDLLADMVALAGDKDAEFAGRKLTLTKRAGSVSYAKAMAELLPKADLEKWRGRDSVFWGLR